jgi:hypothetical protein
VHARCSPRIRLRNYDVLNSPSGGPEAAASAPPRPSRQAKPSNWRTWSKHHNHRFVSFRSTASQSQIQPVVPQTKSSPTVRLDFWFKQKLKILRYEKVMAEKPRGGKHHPPSPPLPCDNVWPERFENRIFPCFDPAILRHSD